MKLDSIAVKLSGAAPPTLPAAAPGAAAKRAGEDAWRLPLVEFVRGWTA